MLSWLLTMMREQGLRAERERFPAPGAHPGFGRVINNA
jgi:hypothetical protein